MKNAAVIGMMWILATSAAAQESARERLEKSPRHHEWVQVQAGDRTVHSFLVYPEVKEKATAVIIIHENRGLTDWVRSVADQVAQAGYIAIAPDLLSGTAPGGGKTSDFPSEDAAREGIYKLPPDQVMADLSAVADYVVKLPACNGKLTVAGFCWGGGQAFRFAGHRPDLKAAFVFYGPAPDKKEDLARIQCPIYGFYGEDDARINTGIRPTAELMKELGKKYEPVIYDDAGHGFMRAGQEPGGSQTNKKAREQAWERWRSVLKSL